MRLVPSSLSGRLLLASALFTLIALVVTLLVMQAVLTRFVTGQVDQRLDNKIVALISQLEVAPDKTIRIRGDADGPPFNEPRHKSFWWIGGPRNAVQTAWLRDGDFVPFSDHDISALPQPPPPPPAQPLEAGSPPGAEMPGWAHPRTIVGTALDGTTFHMRILRRVIAGAPVTLLVAAPLEAIAHPMREVMVPIGWSIAILGVALVLAAFLQVRLGLRPLGRLRGQIAAVRSGVSSRLPEHQPREIMPLVSELNALLAQNAENLTRARRHVANLAHGLKTPLATLSLAVARVPEADRDGLQGLVERIERRVRHHLGRARAAALDGPVRTRTVLAPRLADIIDALRKIHADKRIGLTISCAADLAVACEPQDVDEMLGNLLENAFKYTRDRVDCDVRVAAATIVVSIADDGPGLTPDEIRRVQEPGQRLDEQVEGFGFGLPIARELAELYGGSLTLAPREVGLTVRLILPRSS